MSSNAALKKIRLEEAPAKGAPATPSFNGYAFVAPLDGDARIDVEAWKKERALCFVHRLEHGAIVERGLLVHRPGGAGGATWSFDYQQGDDDDEAGYRFGAHAFVVGEYVSVRDAEGVMRTYRVASVAEA